MTTLEQLVWRIDPATFDPRRGHLIYDPERGSFESQRPMFGGKRLHFYQVVCSSTATADAQGVLGPIGILDPETRVHVQVRIGYQAWIQPHNARDVVRAVAGDAPGAATVKLIVDAVQRRAAAEPGALTTSPERTLAVARELERQLVQQHGLNVLLAIELDRAEIVVPQKFEVALRLADYAEDIALQVDLEACMSEADHGRVVDAATRRPHLTRTLAAVCRDHFVEVGLQQFRTELHGAVLAGLRRQLDGAMAGWFLRVRTVVVTVLRGPPAPPGFLEVATRFAIAVRSYPGPVELQTRVQLALDDEAIYHRAGAPALEPWAQVHAQAVAQQVLFEARYSQLLLQATQWEDRLLQQLRAAARAIGYAVKAQITTPAGPGRDYLLPQRLELSGEYTTAIDTVTSQLELALRVKLESWQSVARLLDRGDDLEAAVRTAVHDEVATYVHALPPIFLFTQFSLPRDQRGVVVPRDDDRDGGPSVEDALGERIARVLRERFGLQVLAFTAKQGPSRIRDAYLALRQAAAIEFEVPVLVQHDDAPVVHHGTLQVETVHADGWPLFQSVLPAPAVVATVAAAALRTLLATRAAAMPTGLPSAVIEAVARRELPGAIAAQLGLSVQLRAWYPEPRALPALIAHAHQHLLAAEIEDQVSRIGEIRVEIQAARKTARRHLALGQQAEADRAEQQVRTLEAQLRDLGGTGRVDVRSRGELGAGAGFLDGAVEEKR